MVTNILFDFFKGGGGYSERVQFGYMEGVGCGWGVLKLVGRGKEFCGPLSIQREFSCIQLLGSQHPSYSAVLRTPKYSPPTMKEGGAQSVGKYFKILNYQFYILQHIYEC